jgi:hypothetical protein
MIIIVVTPSVGARHGVPYNDLARFSGERSDPSPEGFGPQDEASAGATLDGALSKHGKISQTSLHIRNHAVGEL